MDPHTVLHRLAEAEEAISGVPEEMRRDVRIAVLAALLINSGKSSGQELQEQKTPLQLGPRQPTLQDFVKQFTLKTNHERFGVIAYYRIKVEGRPFITIKEIGDAFSVCGFRKPPDMCEAIRDARRRADFLKTAGLGKYSITANGENLILDLQERARVMVTSQ